jgi:hypothetical protein
MPLVCDDRKQVIITQYLVIIMAAELYYGALAMEKAANIKICQGTLEPHLCFATRDRSFREAFGISSESAFVLCTYLNVRNDGPYGGQQVHLLWTLLFLKTYNTQQNLASTCGVNKDTFKAWSCLFLKRITSLDNLVSVVHHRHPLYTAFMSSSLAPLLAIRLTLKTGTCLQIHIKFAKSQWMAQTSGSTSLHHSTPSGFHTRSMGLQSGMKLLFV